MKKLLFGTILMGLVTLVSVPAMAQVSISVGVSLPPPIVFNAPPGVVVLPDTPDVYVVPDVDVDLFFYNGWWWRLWEGRWYRSRYYDRGWAYFDHVPKFYFDVDPGWRGYYRDHNWQGHRWDYEQIPNQRLQQNWQSWHTNQYWQRQKNWGVQGYQPRPPQQQQVLRQQRQQQYQQRPEVQQQRQPLAQQPQRRVQQPQRQPQAQQPQRQEQRPQAQQPQGQPQQRQPQAQPQQRQPQQSVQRPQGEGRRPQAEQPQRSQGRPEGKEGEHEK